MTPEQAAAFINAQTAMLTIELAVLQANDRNNPDQPHTQQAYLDLYARYEGVLGHNAVLHLYQDITRYG